MAAFKTNHHTNTHTHIVYFFYTLLIQLRPIDWILKINHIEMQRLRLNLNVENCESFDQRTRRFISKTTHSKQLNSRFLLICMLRFCYRNGRKKIASPTPKPTNKSHTKSFHLWKLHREKGESGKKIQYYMHVLHMHGRIEALWSGLFAECKILVSHLRWEHHRISLFFPIFLNFSDSRKIVHSEQLFQLHKLIARTTRPTDPPTTLTNEWNRLHKYEYKWLAHV